jgi:hypothetical protein
MITPGVTNAGVLLNTTFMMNAVNKKPPLTSSANQTAGR